MQIDDHYTNIISEARKVRGEMVREMLLTAFKRMMNATEQRTRYEKPQRIVAKSAIAIGVLAAVFYAGFVTASSRVLTISHADPVVPALKFKLTSGQDEAMWQAASSYFPDQYVNQGKNEDGNVMTYEHD
jgi:hypothetical protein